MSRKVNWIASVIAAALLGVSCMVGGNRVIAGGGVPHAVPTPERSLYSEYRGIKIGMPAADVRTKLGKAKETSDALDQYIFSDSESALVYYDGTHNVNAIMITFQGDIKGAPSARDVFGEDVAPNADGMIFRKEDYPKAGYWVSYTRTTSGDQMVNIALGKKM